MHEQLQDVLERSFYRVLDDLTVENNHFDGRSGYVRALAHCAPPPPSLADPGSGFPFPPEVFGLYSRTLAHPPIDRGRGPAICTPRANPYRLTFLDDENADATDRSRTAASRGNFHEIILSISRVQH